MSDVRELKAEARDQVGKGAARAVRRTGRVPAVIYGGGAAPRAISLDGNEIRLRIFAGRFLTTMFDVDVGGERSRVIPRDYQLDPVKDTPLHVDFLRVTEGQTLTVEVPVRFVNQDASPGLKAGGTLNVVRHTVELVVPAAAIPDSIEADLTGLNFGDSLHIGAVKLPENTRPAIERDFTLATIATPAALGGAAEAEQAAVSDAAKAESGAAAAKS